MPVLTTATGAETTQIRVKRPQERGPKGTARERCTIWKSEDLSSGLQNGSTTHGWGQTWNAGDTAWSRRLRCQHTSRRARSGRRDVSQKWGSVFTVITSGVTHPISIIVSEDWVGWQINPLVAVNAFHQGAIHIYDHTWMQGVIQVQKKGADLWVWIQWLAMSIVMLSWKRKVQLG